MSLVLYSRNFLITVILIIIYTVNKAYYFINLFKYTICKKEFSDSLDLSAKLCISVISLYLYYVNRLHQQYSQQYLSVYTVQKVF